MFYDAEKKEHVAGGVDGKASIALDGLRLLRYLCLCVAASLCCSIFVLQSLCVAVSACCSLSVLQTGWVAELALIVVASACCGVYAGVLQSVCVAVSACCSLSVLQVAALPLLATHLYQGVRAIQQRAEAIAGTHMNESWHTYE